MRAVPARLRSTVLGSLLFITSAYAHSAIADEFVCFETNHGDICLTLFPDVAPVTVANFLGYVDYGYYDMTLVHRSVPDFVIQGGGFSGEPDPNRFSAVIPTDPPIINEASRSNRRGTIAMARTDDPNSATNQWFINLKDNTFLDRSLTAAGYAVFGEVVQGLDVVDAIAALPVKDFSYALNSYAFMEMPVDMAPGETLADFEDFVVVKRAYRTNRLPGLLPYQCSLTSPGDTLTEFCGGAVTFPVLVDGVLYEGTLDYLPERSGAPVFAVDRSKLKVLNDTGQERAIFANGVLTLPSLRYGALALVNVRLDLTSESPIEFTLRDYTQR